MKRILLIVMILIADLSAFAHDSLTKKSVMVYAFNNFSVILINQAPKDFNVNYAGSLHRQSSGSREVSVEGQLLRIYITANNNPVSDPGKLVSLVTDGDETTNITVSDLEFKRVLKTGRLETEWKPVDSFPLLKDGYISLFPLTPGSVKVNDGKYHLLFEGGVLPYSTRIFTLRNKGSKKEILNLEVTYRDGPVYPFLMLSAQSASEIKLIDSFLENTVPVWPVPKFPFTDKPVASGKAPDTSRLLRNERLYEPSELVLFFKKKVYYPDSSLQYLLSDEARMDTVWKKTGHRLRMNGLVPGIRYTLKIRYELHPASIQEHSFFISPKWYQTRNAKIAFFLLLITGICSTVFLLYRRRLIRYKMRQELLTMEIKAIRSQLNPHFIFNSLASIQGLINKNNLTAANEYLTEFSSLLRETLHNADKELVPLVMEINLLETYLKLEQLRFGFRFEINVDTGIDKNATDIPYLILQPLVENAVKHGVSSLEDKGLIKIQFLRVGTNMFVLISDNGSDFYQTERTTGFGLKLTRNRIRLLNQVFEKQPITISIERRGELGTIVNLVFTNWI